MKQLFIIEDSLENKITYFHLLFFLVLLPFDRFYSELILISLLVHSLIHLNRKKIQSLPKQFFFLISIYLLTVGCTIYSIDKHQAIKDMEKQLALFLFPFIFAVTRLSIEKYKLKLLNAFSIACVLTTIYLYIDALRTISYNNLPYSSLFSPEFTNHNFSAPIALHATYMSMYNAVALIILMYNIIRTKKCSERIYFSFFMLILALSLVQLASRSVLIAILVIMNFAFPLMMLQKKKKIKFIAVSVLVSLLAVIIITNVAGFKKRFVAELENDLTAKRTESTTSESRAVRWNAALQLIHESPVAGHGSGSEVKLLKEKYFENQLYVSYINELNAHNEYLSMAIKSGMTGLILYIYFLAAGFYNSYRKKDIVFFSFLVIIAIVSLSENILDTNKGIFYFSFFFSVLASPFAEYKLPGFNFYLSRNKKAELQQTENVQSGF